MPVFLDLDNTLVDRDGAFFRWAHHVVPTWGGDVGDVDWLIRSDASGYTPRAELAQMIIARFGPARVDAGDLVSHMRKGIVEHLECYPGVLSQLKGLATIGQSLVILTNGDSKQQRMKIERTGLADIVSGFTISGELGFKKPDPRIFEAARAIGQDDGAVWMVGDHVEADIAGARAAGWATAWVSHGRPWPEQWMPTLRAQEPAELLAVLCSNLRTAR